MKQLTDQAEAQRLALAIVDTLREPFLVLDETLHLLDREPLPLSHVWRILVIHGVLRLTRGCSKVGGRAVVQ